MINEKDILRKKFILKTLYITIISFLSILILLSIYNINKGLNSNGVPLSLLMCFIIINIYGLFLSNKGRIKISSTIILLTIYTCILYGSITWGADLPTVLVTLFITVLISGILINSKFGLMVALALSAHLTFFNYIEKNNILKIDHEWKRYEFRLDDVLEYSILLIFAAMFSWLSNNQMEKALIRSENTEIELQKEKDSLEDKIRIRTKEIELLQIEKINSMYRMVEFGRISSGLFHDIINPLTDISINLQLLEIDQAKKTIDRIIPSINKIERIITQSKKHIQMDESNSIFSIIDEIKAVIQLIESKSNKNKVQVIIKESSVDIQIYTPQILFSHIIMNLVSNAIDSYTDNVIEDRVVIIDTKIIDKNLKITVSDNGCGMNEDVMKRIFEQFYTTKNSNRGCGIGLSATKYVLEKYFNGNIYVISTVDKGTTFTVTIPI